MNINQVILSGNLTRDPAYRTTAGGTPILEFGIAVNDRVQNHQSGEWTDRANFFDCTLYGRSAEPLSHFLHKGDKVALNGRLHYDSWTDRQTGQNRSRVTVTVNNVELMQRRRHDGETEPGTQTNTTPAPQAQDPAPAPKPAPQPAPAVPEPPTEFVDEDDEDMPF